MNERKASRQPQQARGTKRRLTKAKYWIWQERGYDQNKDRQDKRYPPSRLVQSLNLREFIDFGRHVFLGVLETN